MIQIAQHMKERMVDRGIDPKHVVLSITQGDSQPAQDGIRKVYNLGHSSIHTVVRANKGQLVLVSAWYRGKLDNGVK
jgi:hypothetical protein